MAAVGTCCLAKLRHGPVQARYRLWLAFSAQPAASHVPTNRTPWLHSGTLCWYTLHSPLRSRRAGIRAVRFMPLPGAVADSCYPLPSHAPACHALRVPRTQPLPCVLSACVHAIYKTPSSHPAGETPEDSVTCALLLVRHRRLSRAHQLNQLKGAEANLRGPPHKLLRKAPDGRWHNAQAS